MECAGIETVGPRDIKFRSRLEARWASFFDELGWKWEYEPIDLNGYIPDFLINFGDKQVLVEVKGTIIFKDLYEHSKKIIDSGWKGDFIIVGAKLFTYEEVKDRPNIKYNYDFIYEDEDDKPLFFGVFYTTRPDYICYNPMGDECDCGFISEKNYISKKTEKTEKTEDTTQTEEIEKETENPEEEFIPIIQDGNFFDYPIYLYDKSLVYCVDRGIDWLVDLIQGDYKPPAYYSPAEHESDKHLQMWTQIQNKYQYKNKKRKINH